MSVRRQTAPAACDVHRRRPSAHVPVWLGLVALLAISPEPSIAQARDPIKSFEQAKAQSEGSSGRRDSVGDSTASSPGTTFVMPEGWGLVGEDSLVNDRRLDAVRSYYEAVSFGNRHRLRVFRFQHLSTRIIFVMVHVLVLAGLWFSWMQFRDDLARKRRLDAASADKKQVTADAPSDRTTLKASLTEGIELSSSLLGVIILVVSLLFFYLYLVHVYPITIVR